jgi:NAD(P)-dependent dehydrogenase (short-subunit alcohol dehydrogenase family)
MADIPHRQVLITGGCGQIGILIARSLSDRYAITLLDLYPPPPDIHLPFIQADIAKIDDISNHFHGHDTVIHLAADSDPQASWESLLPNNIIGTQNVLQAACEAGCRRVILASSIHAVLGYSPNIIGCPEMLPRPANLYGATKAWGETLGNYYAYQRGLSVLCVRIGWLKDPSGMAPGDPDLDLIITPQDLIQLMQHCIDAPMDIRYGIFHGLSRNRHIRFDIHETRNILTYNPKDDAYSTTRYNYDILLRRWAERIFRALCTKLRNRK